jgi:pyruvate kinase
MKGKLEQKLDGLIDELQAIQSRSRALEDLYGVQLKELHPDQRKSGLNLLHYLALRQHDVSELQDDLGALGLSSLGRAEPHVLANVNAVMHALHSLRGENRALPKSGVTIKQGRKIIRKRTNALLGKKLKGSSSRIMVTLPSEAGDDPALVCDMVAAGMNCARINCAHDGPETWTRMLANIERARKTTGRGCKVFMDLSGPKIRTGTHAPGPRVKAIKPARDVRGRVIKPEVVVLVPEESEPEAPSRAAPPPPPAGGTIPISADLFRSMKPGHSLSFIDTRGEPRRFEIESTDVGRARSLCASTTYLEAGLPVSLEDAAGKVHATGVIGALPATEQALLLRVGDTLLIHKDPRPGEPARVGGPGEENTAAHVSCVFPDVLDDVRVGEPVILDDGKIHGIVRETNSEGVSVEVTHAKPKGTRLKADKGINLPESSLQIFGLTPKDRDDLRFVAKHADGVNVSFVNHPDDVEDLMDEMEEVGGEELGLILKIETRQGFQNLPGILLAAMEWPLVGVMIARGDLAVEVGWTHLAQVQEEILRVCEAAHVPVIWATQVLERLAKKGLPTRSEISDVAMAERAECVMLNKGPYISDTIRTLDTILKSMQAYQRKNALLLPALNLEDPDPEEIGRSVGDRMGRYRRD